MFFYNSNGRARVGSPANLTPVSSIIPDKLLVEFNYFIKSKFGWSTAFHAMNVLVPNIYLGQ